jgi:hypothetical protein
MLSRRFFYAALALALLAVAMQMGAMRYRSDALSIRVRAIRAEQPIDPSAAAQITNHKTFARFMSVSGLVCYVASIGSLWHSARRSERSWRGIPLAFLLFYIMLWFVLS